MWRLLGASMYDTDNIGTSRVFGLKSMKSLLLAVLMVSMSLSVGLVELNKAPWLVENGESELGGPTPLCRQAHLRFPIPQARSLFPTTPP